MRAALVPLLSLTACGAVALGDDITRGEAYALVRPDSCARVLRCAPAQFERDYSSLDECVSRRRPRWPRSGEISDCSRTEAEACAAAEREEPCHVGGVAACEGC